MGPKKYTTTGTQPNIYTAKWLDEISKEDGIADEAPEVKPKKMKNKYGFESINIRTVENGYMVTCDDREFVFPNLDELYKWMKDRMAPTGEGTKFLEKL